MSLILRITECKIKYREYPNYMFRADLTEFKVESLMLSTSAICCSSRNLGLFVLLYSVELGLQSCHILLLIS
jgi:hypothetical protein